MYKIDQNKLDHSPRGIRFWECCLALFYENLSAFEVNVNDSNILVNINGLIENEDTSRFYLDTAFEYYIRGNVNHRPSYEHENSEELKREIYKRTIKPRGKKGKKASLIMQQFVVNSTHKISNLTIAVANTKVLQENIKKGLRGEANLEGNRFNTLYQIFGQTKAEKADMLLLPECFVPIELLDRIVWFAVNEQKAVVTGLEHITIDDVSFNFIVTVLPFEKDGIKDAVVIYRLKNHYSHAEKLMVETNHYKVPQPSQYVYDLFIWKGVYFSSYYCFELADVKHRSLFKSQIDLLVACEWNPDINYFSNIVESLSRDLHVYIAQVNTSQFGDTRITQPAKTDRRDILKLKGGDNDTILIGEINIKALREFQRELYTTTKENDDFKPLPPDFSLKNVLKRISSKPII